MPSPRLRHRATRPAFAPLLGLVFATLLLGPGGRLPSASAGDTPAARAAAPIVSKEDLEKQKLAQEIQQLKIANASHLALWDRGAAVVTALVAVAGLWKTLDDLRRARAQDLGQRAREQEQREQERTQRETESLRWQAEQQADRRRQLEESFGAALANLRGGDDAGKAGAVVSLMTFLRPEYADFHEQVYLVLRAMLKLMCPPPRQAITHDAVKPLFARAFEQAFTTLPRASPLREEPDLARMYLVRASLRGLSLRHADMGFSAMQEADLTGSDLFRVRGIKVQWERACLSKAALGEARLNNAYCPGADFRGAWLVAATLKKADLTKANFQGASLQSAHLEKARLEGANFRGADLRDTYFLGARLDDAALQSIALSHDLVNIWQKKGTPHFSPEIIPRLEQALAVVALRREKEAQGKKKEGKGEDKGKEEDKGKRG